MVGHFNWHLMGGYGEPEGCVILSMASLSYVHAGAVSSPVQGRSYFSNCSPFERKSSPSA